MSSERGLVGTGVGPAAEALEPTSFVVGTGPPVGSPPSLSTLRAPWSGRSSPSGIGPPVVQRTGSLGPAAGRCIPRGATELEEGRNPPLDGGSPHLVRWRLRPLTDLGVVQRHIATRRTTPPTSFGTSLDGSGDALSSAAMPPTAALRLSSDADKRNHPTTIATPHQNSILIIVCSSLV